MRIDLLNRVSFDNMAVHERDGWFCNMFYSALFHVDLQTLEISFLTMLPSKNLFEWTQYSAIEYVDGKLVIAPSCAKDILVYDLKENEFMVIELDDVIGKEKDYSLSRIIVTDGFVYMFPGISDAIVKLDVKTWKVSHIYLSDEALAILKPDPDTVIFLNRYDRQGDYIYIPSYQTGSILKFHLNDDSYSVLSVPRKERLLQCFPQNDEYILSGYDDVKIYTWDGKDKLESICLDFYGFCSESYGIKRIIYCQGNLFYIPFNANMILKRDGKTQQLSCFKPMRTDYLDKLAYMNILGNHNVRYFDLIDDTHLLYYSVYDGKLVKLDLVTGESLEREALVGEEDLRKIHKELVKVMHGQVLQEEAVFTLDEFVAAID